MSNIRQVQPGEHGCDASFHKPPPQLLIDRGYTFFAGYSSYTPAKNCLNPQDYIDAGLAYVDLWEVNSERTKGGYNAGSADGLEAARQAQAKSVPAGLAIVACNDTNTTAANVDKQAGYMDGFQRHCTPYGRGMYDDTDLTIHVPDAPLLVLPSAWGWSSDSRKTAEAKATGLGYHIFQYNSFALDGIYQIDPLTCVRPFNAWGNPLVPQQKASTAVLISNATTGKYGPAYDVNGGGYSVWLLRDEGDKRAIGLPEYTAHGWPGKQVVQTLSDADLDAIPNYVPPVASTPGAPMSFAFQGTGVQQ